MRAPTVHAFLKVRDRAVRVESYRGAEPFAEVVNEPGGLLPYAKKHLGALRWADLEAQVGIDSDPALFEWIGDAWFGNPLRESVELDAFDPVERVARTLELQHAELHEVTLPGMDQGSHERRFLSVRIAPKRVQPRAGGSVIVQAQEPGRELLGHSFTVEIDGIDCSGVLAVDPVKVRTTGGLLVFPDVRLHVDVARARSFRDWFDDFVLGGNNDDDKERAGRITFYDPLLKDALATLELVHLGIFRIAEEPVAGRVQIDLYCERMELKTFFQAL